MNAEIALIGLLVVAVGVALVAKRLKVPYTIALVLAGLALGAVRPVVPALDALFAIHLTPEVLFAVLLPGLLYEAAFHITLRDVARAWRTIGLLAVIGVALSALVAGLLVWAELSLFGVGLPLLAACLFGALICATDPISVLALLKELGVSKRLRMVMEGESLVNDGIAVVMFAALAGLLGVAQHGAAAEHVDAAWVVRLLLWEVGLGILIGTALGAIQSFITSKVDDHLVEITMTVVVAFGSYLVADAVHASGVIAVVSAGVLSGNYGGRYGMSPTTRVAVISLWEVVTFVANSVVFLLIGLETDLVRLAGRAHLIVLAWLAVLAARAFAVWGLAPLLSLSKEKLRPRWKPVMWWGGLHGALSMVLALSLPHSFAHRELIVDLTFGTVLLSILVQGLTIKPLLRKLQLGASPDHHLFDLLQGRLRAAGAALRELHRQREEHHLDDATFEALHEELDARIKQCKLELEEAHHSDEARKKETFVDLRRSLLMIERDSVLGSHTTGAISEEALRDLLREVDERIEELEEFEED